jgi:hypothetical protein
MNMKTRLFNSTLFLLLFVLVTGCNKDLGNYNYDYDKAPLLTIDTIGIDRTDLFVAWTIGDTVHVTPNVTYNRNMDNLVYRWFVIDYPYQTVTEGNAQVWPPADTICRTLSLDYVINLKPGKRYILYFMARDTVSNFTTFFSMRNYITIPEAGIRNGIYCLQEKEGRVDIDVIGSSRALVFSNYHDVDYWSSLHPGEPLEGEARLINYSSSGGYFYIFTGEQGLRVNPSSMTIMERWEEMFYDAPAYNPQAVVGINNCDFLINDGKLHVHYIQSYGERKFSIPIPGQYDLAPTLATQTIASWGAVAGAIGAYQVVYDKSSGSFRPFFNKGISLGQFSETVPEAVFDVNRMEGELVYANTVNSGETMAIMKRDDGYFMHVACFHNVVDNGNLARRLLPLDGLEGLASATCFASGLAGPALFYGSGKNVYSYSYTTGQTASHLLWEGDAGDEVTALCLLGTGGFPTSGRILWIAVWNEASRAGRLVEFEINPVSGVAEAMYAPMFSGIPDNPVYHEGLGKVRFMAQKY